MERQELLDTIEEIEFFPERKDELFSYLENYLHKKDFEVIEKLLRAGAQPNSKDALSDYFLYLLHEYQVEKAINGSLILTIIDLLLKHGGNPNRVAMNNWRAYDYAVAYEVSEVANLLLRYGAKPEIRPKI
ncbi:hypothetical protein [Alkalimarinus alittae]|uniref:Ankyrin repeat domain-containing protein n=1 Tax=Alkalimarinus alittae TaxID=2961619 RepID=A0ABY6N4Z7_9ALTE|nr:hypothetical protein [Alkalimarinus alittae]UZE97193.1 hypothetical protein NKI27_05445 [Alkalimarinus alittae]